MQNPVMDAILSRKTTRKFAQTPLDPAQIQALGQAALASPSGMNAHPYQFIFVENPNLIRELEQSVIRAIAAKGDQVTLERIQSRGNTVFYGAPLLAVIATNGSPLSPVDAGIAAQTLALSAASMNLGSAIIAMARAAFEGEEGKMWADRLGFPDGHQFCLSVAVGHSQDPKPPHELRPEKLTHIR